MKLAAKIIENINEDTKVTEAFNKDSATKNLKNQIDSLSKKIDTKRKSASKMPADKRDSVNKAIDSLEAKKKALYDKMRKLKGK